MYTKDQIIKFLQVQADRCIVAANKDREASKAETNDDFKQLLLADVDKQMNFAVAYESLAIGIKIGSIVIE